MKPSWWKRLLSYVVELPVEKRQSAVSGHLDITLHRGEWKLSTGNAIYSFGRHYTSYSSSFRQLAIEQIPVKSVLLLGSGIGSVARLLEKHPTIKHITALDIDPVMITLAQKYWPDRLKDRTFFVVADAAEWVKQADGRRYDLLIADIFVDDVTPEQFTNQEFLEDLRKRMNPQGILLLSRIHYTSEQQTANQPVIQTFLSVFPDGQTLKAGHNLMLVGRKG